MVDDDRDIHRLRQRIDRSGSTQLEAAGAIRPLAEGESIRVPMTLMDATNPQEPHAMSPIEARMNCYLSPNDAEAAIAAYRVLRQPNLRDAGGVEAETAFDILTMLAEENRRASRHIAADTIEGVRDGMLALMGAAKRSGSAGDAWRTLLGRVLNRAAQ